MIAAVVTGAGIAFGIVLLINHVSSIAPDYEHMKTFYEKYSKLDELEELVDEYFYEDTDDAKLQESVAKGFVGGLDDPYSEYMTAAEYEQWKGTTSGKYDGIGVTFSKNKNDDMVIISVNENSPADKAGLKPGDHLIAVDGKVYIDSSKLSAAIRGRAGTKVKITYSRDGKEKTLEIERAEIKNESVKSEVRRDNLGYIKINAFEDDTATDFDAALKKIESVNARGLIIDLRNNGGGLVESCVTVADRLLPSGKIVSMKDKNGKEMYYESDKGHTDLPYVVLVNGGTASASEIIAAAVKDYKAGEIIGTKTFGKGIVQSTRKLNDGDALKLTIEQYFSPKGNKIHKKGVKPDRIVKDIKKTEKDEQLEKALELLK